MSAPLFIANLQIATPSRRRHRSATATVQNHKPVFDRRRRRVGVRHRTVKTWTSKNRKPPSAPPYIWHAPRASWSEFQSSPSLQQLSRLWMAECRYAGVYPLSDYCH
ncbi:hypothetical protein E2542_SST17163 [Spatholobus suberectus]|nr:hypothetical protein E2542_SST17163 [Spatholobus suberectus]